MECMWTSASSERSSFGPVSKMALMNKDDVKRAIVVISALSIMLFIALWLLIETGVILAEAP